MQVIWHWLDTNTIISKYKAHSAGYRTCTETHLRLATCPTNTDERTEEIYPQTSATYRIAPSPLHTDLSYTSLSTASLLGDQTALPDHLKNRPPMLLSLEKAWRNTKHVVHVLRKPDGNPNNSGNHITKHLNSSTSIHPQNYCVLIDSIVDKLFLKQHWSWVLACDQKLPQR